MNALKRLLREYNLISAAIVAIIGFAMVMEWIALTEVQMGALLGVVAAVLLVLRFLVTPVADPILPPDTVVNASTNRYPTSTVTPDPE